MTREYKYMVRTYCATYNHEPYILDALNGFVIQQTNFPVVFTIVDDASTDRNADVIRGFVNENFDLQDTSVAFDEDTDYGHVTFAQHKTNRNCYFAVIFLKENHYSQHKSKARYLQEWDNTKYVANCEGDDYWSDPLKLQKQVVFMEAHVEYDMCCTRFVHYFEESLEYDERDLYSCIIDDVAEGKELLSDNFLTGSIPHPCTYMYRKGTYGTDGLIKKLKYKYDIPSLWCFMRSHRVWLINEKTAVYRKHEDSFTARNELSRTTTFYETYKDIYKYDKDSIIKTLCFRWFKSYVVQYIMYSNSYSLLHVIGICFEFLGFRPSWVECKTFGVSLIKAHRFRVKTSENERMECKRF